MWVRYSPNSNSPARSPPRIVKAARWSADARDDLTCLEYDHLIVVEQSPMSNMAYQTDITSLWMAGLVDPDGHHIILMQERANS
jgi:hypothetical protein